MINSLKAKGCISMRTQRESRRIKRTKLIIGLIFAAMWIWFWELGPLPYTRRWFINYDSFNKKTGIGPYPEELPASAEDIRYFYYSGWFDEKTGISFTVSQEEYQDLKETYLSSYAAKEEEYQKKFQQRQEDYRMNRIDYEPKDWFWYVLDEEMTTDFLDNEGLDYLKKVFHNKTDNYTILAYEKAASADALYYLSGIFYNDDTNEIVMFDFRDSFRKEKE